ncbi:glycoside hydrolase family 11 protein [Stipitochalara longipes BDJ]|nr:glycoside hydrolase family 11 protein [Stipitochalara longipes BDJ]
MISFSSLLLAGSAITAAFAAPRPLPDLSSLREQAMKRDTPQGTGTDDGFFYSNWSDGKDYTYNNLGSGEYSVSWTSGSGNLVVGKGWNPGAAKNVTYSGTWKTSGNGYLSLYGWTVNPLVEYYITENFGSYDPSSAASKKGTVTSDGSVYNILSTTRTNEPSINGTATFQQFWSVRQNKRVGGTINTGAHFAAWAKYGMKMGDFNYMIIATEGYHSTGSADIKVGELNGTTSS